MKRRERLERRADRREEWAESATRKSEAGFRQADKIASGIPMGQPVLVGHYSERRHRADLDRIDSGMRKGVENEKLATRHESAAASIRGALDKSIYSDDDDAITALESRIAEREAERARITDYNASCRKAAKTGGVGDTSLLTDGQRADLMSIAKHAAYQLRPGGGLPPYVASNLSGRIKADRDRLEAIKARQKRQARAEEAGGMVIQRCRPEDREKGLPGTAYCSVVFADAPGRAICAALKEAGFWYSGGSWTGKEDRLPQIVLDQEE